MLGLQLRCSRVVSRVRVTAAVMIQLAAILCTPCAFVFVVKIYAHGIEMFGSE